jgi:hypothetical protein
MTTEEARKRHALGDPYVAVIYGDNGRKKCFVELASNCVIAGILDNDGREYMSYQFQGTNCGKLFLSLAIYRKFDGDRIIEGTSYFFEPDGCTKIQKEDFLTGDLFESEGMNDLKNNWEEYPAFGEYTAICRKER